jgi:hypothetical protein
MCRSYCYIIIIIIIIIIIMFQQISCCIISFKCYFDIEIFKKLYNISSLFNYVLKLSIIWHSKSTK